MKTTTARWRHYLQVVHGVSQIPRPQQNRHRRLRLPAVIAGEQKVHLLAARRLLIPLPIQSRSAISHQIPHPSDQGPPHLVRLLEGHQLELDPFSSMQILQERHFLSVLSSILDHPVSRGSRMILSGEKRVCICAILTVKQFALDGRFMFAEKRWSRYRIKKLERSISQSSNHPSAACCIILVFSFLLCGGLAPSYGAKSSMRKRHPKPDGLHGERRWCENKIFVPLLGAIAVASWR